MSFNTSSAGGPESPASPVAPGQPSQRLLIIDDSKIIHTLVAARLVSEPVEILSAFDGESGLALAREVKPDLILLDVDMPRPNGFEVCRRLKDDPATLAVPIIFLTGASSTGEKIRGLEMGAADYVTKPFDSAELRARVRACLRTKFLMDLLAKRAMVDGLTGLWNRAYLDHRLVQEMSLARRNGQPLSCVLADVDHFKSLNDRYGHPFGDDALRTIGQVLTAECREEDVVCRYGGEEFAILTPAVSSAGAQTLARRLRQRVELKALRRGGEVIRATCSFGVADVADVVAEGTVTGAVAAGGADEVSAFCAALFASADRALYRAKQAGRNCVASASHRPAA